MFILSGFLPGRPQDKSSTHHVGRPHYGCSNRWLKSSRSSDPLPSHRGSWYHQNIPGPQAEAPLPPRILFCSSHFPKGLWGILTVTWFHLVKNRYQHGPVTLLYHVFALLQTSDVQKFPATAHSSGGERAVFTKEHLHLLATELPKAALLAGGLI